jgi:hypothetical protein
LGWAKNIEDKLMKDMKLEYDEVGGDKRGDIGCIEWLINHCKRELVKLINARSSTSHGMKITITRKRGTVNTENRFKKRQKGAFYADFVKGASQILSSSTASQKAPPTVPSDGDDLKVCWSTGATMWAYEGNVKIDEPEMVARFYAATMVSPTSMPSKKARAELEMIEKRGACSGGHSSCEDFTIEEDSRYWNQGNSFHNVKCGKCEGE